MEGHGSQRGIAVEIADLGGLCRADLIARWTGVHGKAAPPPTITRDLLVRGLAYAIQERALGGLRLSERRTLFALAKRKVVPTSGGLKPGTRLYRAWQGTTHEVLVLDIGYGWQGETYRSLSEVARAIIGTRWSGPRFFGLTP